MKESEKPRGLQRKKIGVPGYFNEKCWLIKTLNYIPYSRCQYCNLEFRNCLFLHYQLISLALIIFFLTLSFFIEKGSSKLVIISLFTLIIIYGYFFNKSTDKIIKTNFELRKAKGILEDLSQNLQQKVEEQTKEIKRAYEVEKKAHLELKRLTRAREQFLLSSQHYFRTPLTAVIGYLEMMAEGTCGKEKIPLILESAKELRKRIEESLAISQFRARKGILELKKIQLEDLLKEITKEFDFQIKEKELYLKIHFPEEKLPRIKIDPVRMKEVYSNLIDNAIKHTSRGGVDISLELKIGGLKLKNQNSILFSIKDTGIGIPEGEISYIGTAPFERGREARKLSLIGKGIGLYLSKLIVRAHSGELWAESKGPGKGSVFFIELPIK